MRDLGGKTPNWGYTESVLVDGNRVVCTPGGENGTMVALNRQTGQVLWQSADLKDPAHYSSVIVASHDLGLVKRMRRRVLVLDHGRLMDDISPEDLAA